jgi:hypothetical protein
MNTNKRVRLFIGDTDRPDFEKVHSRKPEPGLDWNEAYDVTGYIRKSGGIEPCAIILNNRSSMYGPSVMDSCIVKIMVDNKVVYELVDYHNKLDSAEIVESELAPEYSHAVRVNGEEYARFHSEKSAKRYLDFMTGKRMSK